MNVLSLRFIAWRRLANRCVCPTSAVLLAVFALSVVGSAFAVEVKAINKSDVAAQPRVFVLSVADQRGFDSNGLKGLQRDVERIKFFFENHVPKRLLTYTSVDPDAATPEAVLNAIDAFKKRKIDKNDVVFFYYSGHAAYDPENGDAYFSLQNANGEVLALYREDVKKRLLALGARLVVIFTDCCNKTRLVPEGMAYVPAPLPSKGAAKDYSSVMKKLFVDSETRGIVDLTSSAPGEYSYAFVDGSVATTVAIKTFENLDKENASVVDWRRFVDEWTRETETFSQERRKRAPANEQKKQTPYVYELPLSVRPPAFSGIAFSHKKGEALKVASVKGTSPADKAGVQKNDVVRRLDGRVIDVVQDYRDALTNVSDEAELVVLRNGKLQTLTLKGLRGGK